MKSIIALIFFFCYISLFSQTDSYLNTLKQKELRILNSPVVTYYSDGYEDRAELLSNTLYNASLYFDSVYSAKTEIYLALLNQNDWSEIRKEYPYGLPNVASSGNKSLIFLPADHKAGVVADVYARITASVPDSLIQYFSKIGLTYDEAYPVMVDIIGFHELGHSIVRSMNIHPPYKWFDEYLASYLAYDFMINKQPETAKIFYGMVKCGLAALNPKHTSLKDFEELYVRVGVDNYMWYQSKFLDVAVKVHSAGKEKFIYGLKQIIKEEGIEPILFMQKLNDIDSHFTELKSE